MSRIKILFFIEELQAGGAEKVLANLVNHMDQNSFDITVQTVWKNDDPRSVLMPGIRYRYCFRRKSRLNVFLYRLEAALGLFHWLHIHERYDLEAAFLEFGPTKVLANSPKNRAKRIAWLHCDIQRKIGGQTDRIRKNARWYARYDQIVCVAEDVRKSFVSLFGLAQKTVVLYNVIDDRTITAKAAEPISVSMDEAAKNVVAVGRLSPEKGYDRLIRAHAKLLSEGYDHKLMIIGDGPQRQSLETLAAETRCSASVSLPGYQANPYPMMKKADLLVCSSQYEGFSTFVSEGLILGKAILTTDCSGMRELLGNSTYGSIVENSDAGLLEGLRAMLADDHLRESYSRKAFARGRDFSHEALVQATEDFFRSLV